MSYLILFAPFLLFVSIFFGTGIYFTLHGVRDAFCQISPAVAIIPSIVLGWLLHRGNTKERMAALIGGICHRDIITMVIIFLLAGAFCAVTGDIGSIQSAVNLALAFIPARFILVGIFLISAFISTSIGTSMGTIAAIGPIAAAMCESTHFSPALAMATVVGGAMLGDNLSIVSDTTIASVLSQGADIGKKFRFNAKIALVAAALTVIALLFMSSGGGAMPRGDYSIVLISPYFILLALALSGVNVLIALTISIAIAGGIGICTQAGYGFIALNNSIHRGFMNMGDLVILSMFIGGLSGLISQNLIQKIAASLSSWSTSRPNGTGIAQLLIGALVSAFDLMVANNTIAIVICGGIAKEIAEKNAIPPHISATWLGSFSCVFQGIIPYAPQLLLAGAIAGISPLSITPLVIYCYLLLAVSIFRILRARK